MLIIRNLNLISIQCLGYNMKYTVPFSSSRNSVIVVFLSFVLFV